MPPIFRPQGLLLSLVAVVACAGDKNTSATDGTTGTTGTTAPATTSTTSEASTSDPTGDPTVTGSPTTTTTATTTTTSSTSDAVTTGGPGTTSGSDTTTTAPDTSTGTTAPDTTTGGGSTTADTDTTTGMAGCDPLAPRIVLSTTLGDMVVQLDAVNAPLTVANFLDYVDSNFYDGTIIHRVIPGFVLQGGGHTPDLTLKPTNAPIADEVSPALSHVDGAISMANAGPNTATSQFFLCDGAQPQLDGDYAVFGVLVEGFEVRDAIMGVPTHNEGMYGDVPIEDVIVESAYCVE